MKEFFALVLLNILVAVIFWQIGDNRTEKEAE